MLIKDRKIFSDMARRTGVFREMEIDILAELVEACASDPATTYRMICETENGEIAGFTIFGRVPLTDFGWDIYWLVVDKAFHGKGLATKLMKKTEEHILGESDRAVIRVETSSRMEYLPARKFYLSHGFEEAGDIKDFYAAGDGIKVYSKQISRKDLDRTP